MADQRLRHNRECSEATKTVVKRRLDSGAFSGVEVLTRCEQVGLSKAGNFSQELTENERDALTGKARVRSERTDEANASLVCGRCDG